MSVTIKPDQAYAYAEVLEIISLMEDDYVNRIPKKLLDIFETNKSLDYTKHLDPNISLEEQTISDKASALLGMLMINYWCDSEEQKQTLINAYKENERKYQEDLKEKYNPDNIFKNNNQITDVTSSTTSEIKSEVVTDFNTQVSLPMDYTSFPWYKKVFTKIRLFVYSLFKKDKKPT